MQQLPKLDTEVMKKVIEKEIDDGAEYRAFSCDITTFENFLPC